MRHCSFSADHAVAWRGNSGVAYDDSSLCLFRSQTRNLSTSSFAGKHALQLAYRPIRSTRMPSRMPLPAKTPFAGAASRK